MCGIAGLVTKSQNSVGYVDAMLAVQIHRGPDDCGIWTDKDSSVVLGHRRLSIIDLSKDAAQPMSDATGQYVITYNGEIYNYIEVRQELAKLGVVFRSQSDTEVLLEAYKIWGTGCLSRFNGMFAFVLYDKQKSELFCARDRYGEKPFLFSFGHDFFAFASEFKSLLQHSDISLDINEMRLMQSAIRISSGADSDRETIFSAIKQLLPSEAMIVDVNTFDYNIWRYWQIEPKPLLTDVNEPDVFQEFKELLTDAVRLRLRSDVSVGSCLSGGLDSSAIVCLARQLIGKDTEYKTFTGRFPGSAVDEWKYAQLAVEAANVRSYIVEPNVERFMSDMPQFIWHNELPVGSSSQYAQWSVFALAKENGVKVLLDGQGADEGLGGYEGYFRAYLQALRECGDYKRCSSEEPLIRQRYPEVFPSTQQAWRNKVPLSIRHKLYGCLNKGTSLIYGLDSDVVSELIDSAKLPLAHGFNALSNTLLQNSFGGYLTSLLRYGDRNSMAHSIEVRLPFCDHRIAEFIHCLPPQLLMGEIQNKRLLRESMRGIIPEELRTRWRKQGFVPPQADWFKSEDFVSMVRDTFNSNSFRQNNLWRHKWWDKALDRINDGESGLSGAIWHPFIQECWRKEFLEKIKNDRLKLKRIRLPSVEAGL